MVKTMQEHSSMDSIHQAKLKSGYVLHKMALFQSQRNTTVGFVSLKMLFQATQIVLLKEHHLLTNFCIILNYTFFSL